MFSMNHLYHPITAHPFLQGGDYGEYPPSPALEPFIRCYWGTDIPRRNSFGAASDLLVVPDGCMDIMVQVNHTTGRVSTMLAAMQDTPFVARRGTGIDLVSNFAIRFHFWALHLFLPMDFAATLNQKFEMDAAFSEWTQFFHSFLEICGMRERITATETFLKGQLGEGKENNNVLNAAYHILRTGGSSTVKDACAYASVSQRQMERLFLQSVGMPMKRLSGVVRYQNVWRDIALSPTYNIHDLVQAYGFTDESHLLASFRQYHTMYPGDAKSKAVLITG